VSVLELLLEVAASPHAIYLLPLLAIGSPFAVAGAALLWLESREADQ
jgi:hypothetical protein